MKQKPPFLFSHRALVRWFKLLLPVFTILFCVFYFFSNGKLNRVSEKERKSYIKSAKVWHATNIPAMDLLAGPASSISAPLDSVVECRYIQTPKSDGFSPKFQCALSGTGEIVRVKFNRRETFGEIAGSRLLWALGFYSDENYSVKIRCLDCPDVYSPNFSPRPLPRHTVFIEDGIIEKTFPGATIEVFDNEGWNWDELEEVSAQSGGSDRTQVDALKLLAVFLQHTDSKHEQQRIGCYEEDIRRRGGVESCTQPVMMLQDLGATFGIGEPHVTAGSSMFFRGWSGKEIWSIPVENEYRQQHPQEQSCFGSLVSTESDGLFNPKISEEGRVFLSRLLNQLSDRQIRDLFTAARADKTGERRMAGNELSPVTVEDWVSAFKEKRQSISDHSCN